MPAEVGAVLGIISAVIAIVDGTKKVYDAASDAQGLPEAFREVSARLPLIKDTLKSVREHVEDGNADAESCKAIASVIARGQEKAAKLDALFQKVMPAGDASWHERYWKAAKAMGKGSRVEDLMKGLLEDVLLITSRLGLDNAKHFDVEKLKEAISVISEIEPTIPDAELESPAFTNNNFGSGPMTNNNVMGDMKNQSNYGSGDQYQAENQTFNISKKNRDNGANGSQS